VLKTLAPGLQVRVLDLALLMIIVSDNVATNLLIDYLGGVEPVNAFIQRCGLSHTTLNRKSARKSQKPNWGSPPRWTRQPILPTFTTTKFLMHNIRRSFWIS
jgi:beta-lactamase class A